MLPSLTVRRPHTRRQVLSSFRADPHTFVQRVAVALPTGEEAVLTFTLGSEEEVVPQYRSMGVRQRWVLRAIRGEPNHAGECPTHPTAKLSPELVVQAQLKALQDGDFASVFAFASPANKVSRSVRYHGPSAKVQSSRPALPNRNDAHRSLNRGCGGACDGTQEATGPLDRFSAMLRTEPYDTLVGHSGGTPLRDVQLSPTRFVQLVGFGSIVFSWAVRRLPIPLPAPRARIGIRCLGTRCLPHTPPLRCACCAALPCPLTLLPSCGCRFGSPDALTRAGRAAVELLDDGLGPASDSSSAKESAEVGSLLVPNNVLLVSEI